MDATSFLTGLMSGSALVSLSAWLTKSAIGQLFKEKLIRLESEESRKVQLELSKITSELQRQQILFSKQQEKQTEHIAMLVSMICEAEEILIQLGTSKDKAQLMEQLPDFKRHWKDLYMQFRKSRIYLDGNAAKDLWKIIASFDMFATSLIHVYSLPQLGEIYLKGIKDIETERVTLEKNMQTMENRLHALVWGQEEVKTV